VISGTIQMQTSIPRVVIIGAGFGGLQAAKKLGNKKINVTLIDENNHHLFQPLLYQVASSALSPGEIAVPIRTIIRGYKNIHSIMSKAISIDKIRRIVYLEDGEIEYDYLILAPGARHSYFGNDEWEKYAPGLKNLNDALKIREKMLYSFELAERNYNSKDYLKYLTFVIVGGGPTGVEMAGAIAEIGRKTMLPDFPIIKDEDIKVILIESGSRLLHSYHEELSAYTEKSLKDLGVDVKLNTRISNVGDGFVTANNIMIETENVIWAAGNAASPILKTLDTNLDNMGRVIVESDMSIQGYPNIFVIGDAAFHKNPDGSITPGIAPAANQQAIYVANNLLKNSNSSRNKPFVYFDKGSMATIGKAKAVAMIGNTKLKGFSAWLLWSFIHIFFLIDFRNRFRVMTEWIWFYLTNRPGARLIVNRKRLVQSHLEKEVVKF
jgi:NADH dehydrogenase